MLIHSEQNSHVISTEDSPSTIQVFKGDQDTFVIEQDAGVLNIHQTTLTRQEMFQLGAFFINLANGTY